jgi:hypothetical protein
MKVCTALEGEMVLAAGQRAYISVEPFGIGMVVVGGADQAESLAKYL